MADNSLGTAGIQVYADTAQFQNDMGKAGAIAEREMRRIQQQSTMAAAIVNELGNRMKLTANTTETAWRTHAAAAAKAEDSIKKAAHATDGLSLASHGAQRELIVLAHEMSQGNYSRFGGSMLVLAERTNAASLLFSGLGLSILGSAAATAAFGVALYQGYKQQQDFNNAIQLTGNYAALTEKKLQDMAEAQAKATGSTHGSSYDTLAALAGTGKFDPTTLQVAGDAMQRYRELNHATAEDALKNFEAISNGAAKWAASQNESMHFLTIGQYQQIKAMEETGDRVGAMRLALDDYDAALRSRHIPNLGYFSQAWEALSEKISEAHNAVMSWGQTTTLDDTLTASLAKVNSLRDSLGQLMSAKSDPGQAALLMATSKGGNLDDVIAKRTAELNKAVADLKAAQNAVQYRDALANGQAKLAQVNDTAIRAAAGSTTNAPAAPKADPYASYERLNQSIAQYAQETLAADDASGKLAESDRWAIQQKTALANVTEKLTQAQRDSMNAAIDIVAAQRKQQDLIKQDPLGDFIKEQSRIADFRQQALDQTNAHKSSFGAGLQDGAKTWWDDFNDQAKRGQEAFAKTMQSMEDAVVSWAKTGKFNASDFFSSMAEDFLRYEIKAAEAAAFYGTGPNGETGVLGGAGSWIAGLSGLLGGGGLLGFANGTPSIAQDGPYYLHEGERVMTKQQNLAYSASGNPNGGAGVYVDQRGQVTNVGAGVSLPQVASMVKAGNQANMQQIRRLMREGVFSPQT
jgi:phage-related minor tail protein